MPDLFELTPSVKVTQEGRRYYFHFPYNAEIIDRLKVRGAKWDKDKRLWWIGTKTKYTEGLLEVFEEEATRFYGNTGGNFPKVLFERGPIKVIETSERIEFGFPYNKKIMGWLKDYMHARWDAGKQVWYTAKGSPKLESAVEFIKARADDMIAAEKEKEDFKAELSRRIQQGLGIKVPFDFKDEAKNRGGIWFEDGKVWLMPDKETYDDLVTFIAGARENQRQQEESARQREILREVEKNTGRTGIKFQDLISIRFSDTSRSHGPVVGNVFRHNGEVVEIVAVSDARRVEEGMSFGYNFDYGWAWTAYALPANALDKSLVEEEEQRRLSQSEAMRRAKDLAQEIQRKGEFPRETFDPRHLERLGILNKSDIIRGGGSWFLVDPRGGYIWYVLNRGMDGDNWADSNVGPGSAQGWRVRYDAGLADEIYAIDKALGGKGKTARNARLIANRVAFRASKAGRN